MVENDFKQKNVLVKYCFKHEYKLKSKNPEKVLNKKFKYRRDKTVFWENTIFPEKKNVIISTMVWNIVICFELYAYSRYLLINSGAVIHGDPGARVAEKRT